VATTDSKEKTLRVLLADDDWPILRALKYRIEHAGHAVDIASDGINAVVVAEKKPDIAVIDVNMPGLDGFAVAKKISSIQPGCKIIFLTASKSKEVRDHASSMGASFVEKPFDSKQLTDHIAKLGGSCAV